MCQTAGGMADPKNSVYIDIVMFVSLTLFLSDGPLLLCLSVSLTVRRSLPASVVSLSLSLYASLSVFLLVCFSVCLSAYLSVRLSVCLSVSIFLFFCLSVSHPEPSLLVDTVNVTTQTNSVSLVENGSLTQ